MKLKHALLLPLGAGSFLFAKTVASKNPANIPWAAPDFYQNTLLAISLIAMLLLLLHIIKSYRGRLRTSVMLRVLLYYVIFVAGTLLAQHFVGDLFAIASGAIYMFFMTERVFK